MRLSQPEEYIGIDVGAVRVGVARGSDAARLAEPLATWPAAEAFGRLSRLAGASRAAAIVVGLPRGLEGQETPQTKAVRAWVKQTQPKINLPFYWQDEALTSQAAGTLQASSPKKQTVDEHSRAAAIILQDFLDTPEAERVRC